MLKISLVTAFAVASSLAHAADVYVSFDDAGVARFAERALDDSYRLLIKDLQAEVRSQSAAPAGHAGPNADIRAALEGGAQRHGLEYALLHAIAQVESGFNPMAVSPKGAIGLMQLMPGTAQRYGVQAADAAALRGKLHQLPVNVDAGARYLRDLMRQFNGQTELVLAAYNAGEGAVRKAGNRIPAYPETQGYVEKVMRIFRKMQGAEAPSPTAAQEPYFTAVKGRAQPVRSAGHNAGVQLFRGDTVELQKFEQGFGLHAQ